MTDKKISNISLQLENEKTYANVEGLSLQSMFFVKNRYFPSSYMFKPDPKQSNMFVDVDKILESFINTYPDFEHSDYIYYDIKGKKYSKIITSIIPSLNLFIRIEPYLSDCYILYGNNSFDDANKIANIFIENQIMPEVEKNNFYKISSSQSGYHLTKMKVKELESFSIEDNYNDDFVPEHEKIDKFIGEDDKSGLVILHGGKGTGKTTYIKNLISKHSDKKFIFVPSNQISMLGDPSFGDYLVSSLNNCVIILEDCEDAIRSRKVSNNAGAVSLLLNMSDGLMSDDLGIKFICTFNEDIKNIDDALTRKGRLVSKYEFKELSQKKTNKLLEKLYNDKESLPVSDKGLSLADIYGYYDSSYENNKKSVSF